MSQKAKCGGRKCCVPGCSKSSYKNINTTFSTFPKDESLREKWITTINANCEDYFNRLDNIPWKSSVRKVLGKKYQTICGYHFSKDGRRKYGQNMPCYFYHKTDELASAIESETIPEVSSYVVISNEPTSIETTNSNNSGIGSQIDLRNGFNEFTTKNDENDHSYSLKKNFKALTEIIRNQQKSIEMLVSMVSSMGKLTEENVLLKKENQDLKKELTKLSIANKDLSCVNSELQSVKETLASVESENKSLKRSLQLLEKNKPFSLNSITNSEMLKFYTGFSSERDFKAFFEFIEPDLSNLAFHSRDGGYKRQTERKNSKSTGRPMALEFKDQMFLVLCRLKVGLLEEDLAYRFGISVSTVSNICITWFDLLFKRLSQRNTFPSVEAVDEDIPEEIKCLYPSTRMIVDAKELSDVELTGRSKTVDRLESGDAIIPDRESNFEPFLNDKNVGQNVSPFRLEVNGMSDFVSMRLHDERVIRKYHLLNSVFTKSTNPHLQKVWKICAFLSNFSNEPLNDINGKSEV